MAEITEYKQWLSSGITNREVIETMEISHPAWARIFIANADRSLSATLEDASTQTFTAGRFYMEPPETTDTTNQSTTIAISALDGQIYDMVRDLTFEEREDPIQLTYRLFFLDDPSEPLIVPPPVWYVHGIEATREAVRAQLQATQLRIQKIGLYYTAKEFPAIVFL